MSTMLKTAAMSLLSKTLQTFLYKYLSDVDVEGVALPSVYDGSGWGVRLSNVKLREGVQLMEQMPGTLKKKRKRKGKGKKRSKTTHASETVDAGDSSEPQSSATLPQSPLPDATQHPFHPALATSESPPQDGTAKTLATDQDYQEELFDEPLHFKEVGHLRPTRCRASSMDDLEVSVCDEGPATPPGSRPTTPLQDSKSFFSCFTNSKASAKQIASIGQDGTESAQPKPPVLSNRRDESAEAESLPPMRTIEKGCKAQVSNLIDEEDTDSTADSAEDSDDEEEYEQPLRLCLGENGRIGTLDIRLIGKELHVRVEDALLTIEAFPVEESTHEEMEGAEKRQFDGQGTAQSNDATSTASGTSATDGAAPPPKSATKPEKEKHVPKRDSVGDRVLADNPLARAIAAIPHLFLRDIRIRFIIRKEPWVPKAKEDDEDGSQHSKKTAGEMPSPSFNQPTCSPDDTMLEVGIEFLSVTNGEDALLHFQEPELDDWQGADDERGEIPKPAIVAVPSSVDTPVDQNDYMVRHIRTGKGPSAGIWVQIFAPRPQAPRSLRSRLVDPSWARQQWVLATNFHILRCSGLDIRARIHLGTKKASGYSWFYDYDGDSDEFDYDESTLDAMLLGIDNIVPGPKIPLPPATPNMSRGNTPIKTDSRRESSNGPNSTFEHFPALHPGAGVYTRDKNDIQSCKVPSTFHRISRGMLPGSCRECAHLPSETCSTCWESSNHMPSEVLLDKSMPMPGIVLQVSLRDPLEINVDRSSVETLHLLKTLFMKDAPKGETAFSSNDKESGAGKSATTSHGGPINDDTTQTTASSSMFAGFLTSRTKEPEKETVVTDAFASFMQPENIQVVGAHIPELILRVHVMGENSRDMALSFCYWELLAGCLTFDHQSLNSKKKRTQDLKFDVGSFTWDEFSGTGRNRLVSLGLPPPSRDGIDSVDSVSTMKSMMDDHACNRSPWPSAACALMDIPPPLETLQLKSRERHGLQFRFIAVDNPTTLEEPAKSMINVRLGTASVHMPWGFWNHIITTRQRITWGVLGGPDTQLDTKAREDKPISPQAKSITTYSIQIDGGSIEMDPIINISMPRTCFSGEHSSEEGVFFETVLEKLAFSYGQKSTPSENGLSLEQLASLPESLRMRVLLCLQDLNPLEEALEIKKESNPFTRTRAVNKGILRMARKMSKTSKRGSKNKTKQLCQTIVGQTRRQTIMADLTKLDDQELDDIWALHQRHQLRLAKKQRNNLLPPGN